MCPALPPEPCVSARRHRKNKAGVIGHQLKGNCSSACNQSNPDRLDRLVSCIEQLHTAESCERLLALVTEA